jgi:hypothetical protein
MLSAYRSVLTLNKVVRFKTAQNQFFTGLSVAVHLNFWKRLPKGGQLTR